MEEREELIMVPLQPGISISRKSHFLKPIEKLVQTQKPSPNSVVGRPKNVTFKITMKGGCPQRNWKKWVHELIPFHQETWKKGGIFEGVLASTYKINKQKELVVAFAERWCVESNTFVFPWGEATVTLEDLMVLGGFSVLGIPVFEVLENDLVKTYDKIIAYCNSTRVSYYGWMEYFMGKGGEIEHVAFLVLWLSRYVFPVKQNLIAKNVFAIAVHLSKGVQVALAPAVLSSIYNDLSLLKRLMGAFSENNGCGFEKDEVKVSVWSPLYFVQLWAWERFPNLRPNPCSIKYGEPRLARWENLGELKVKNVRKLIDCSGESFRWKPYAVSLGNWEFDRWYKDDEVYVLVDSEMESDVEEFVRFVRVSELVGLDCIENYAPHRVAMQFGFDQDIPGCVNRQNETPQTAWSYYNRPIASAFIYRPPKLFEASVSMRYFEWWYQEKVRAEDSLKKSRKLSEIHCVKEESIHPMDIQNLPSSYDIRTTEDRMTTDIVSSDEEDGLSITQFLSRKKKQKVSEHNVSGETLVQCRTLSTSVLNDVVTSMDPVEVVTSDLPSTGSPKRDTLCVDITHGLSGNLDHGKGDNSNSSAVERNGLKCASQKVYTLVGDHRESEIKQAGATEEMETTREDGNAAAKLANMEADTLKFIETRLSNLEDKIRDIRFQKQRGELKGNSFQHKPAEGS